MCLVVGQSFCQINMMKIDQELFGWATPTVYEILEMYQLKAGAHQCTYIPHVQKFEKAFYSVCETFQHSVKNVAIKSLSLSL
jgi:hypothetical protein